MLMVFVIVGFIVMFVVFYGIKYVISVYEVLFYEIFVLSSMSFYICIVGVIKVELFFEYVWAFGVGLVYVIVNAFFGGSVSYVVL